MTNRQPQVPVNRRGQIHKTRLTTISLPPLPLPVFLGPMGLPQRTSRVAEQYTATRRYHQTPDISRHSTAQCDDNEIVEQGGGPLRLSTSCAGTAGLDADHLAERLQYAMLKPGIRFVERSCLCADNNSTMSCSSTVRSWNMGTLSHCCHPAHYLLDSTTRSVSGGTSTSADHCRFSHDSHRGSLERGGCDHFVERSDSGR